MRSWHLIKRIQRSNDMKYNPCHGINRNQRVYLVVVKRFKVVRARYFPSRRRWSTSENLENLKDGEDPIRGNNNLRWRKRVGKLQWGRGAVDREKEEKGRSRGILSAKGKLMVIEGYRVIRVGETLLEWAFVLLEAWWCSVAIKTRSLSMKKRKKERRNWPKESRGETTRNLHFRQSRDELGGERSDDLVFTFSKGRSFFSSFCSFYTVDYPNAFVFKLNSFFLTDHPREFQNWLEYFYRNWIKLNLLFITIISIYKLCHFETFRSTIQNYICNFTSGIHHRWRRITGIIKENWNYQIHNIVSKRFNDERRKDLVTCVTSNWFLDFITLESDGFREYRYDNSYCSCSFDVVHGYDVIADNQSTVNEGTVLENLYEYRVVPFESALSLSPITNPLETWIGT